MKYILLIFMSIVLATNISCESDLDIVIPDKESKIVINSLIGLDSLIRVHISKSSVLNQNIQNIQNAKVHLKQNNKEFGQMKSIEDGWYILDEKYLKSNNSYQIEISHPNFETCNAQMEVPQKVSIDQFSYTKADDSQLNFSIEFQDDASENNYYMILLKKKQDNNSYDIEYNSDDIIFNGNLSINPIGLQQSLLRGSRSFSDENRNGEKISVSFHIYNESYTIDQLNNEYQVVLYHITQDYYKYERSLTTIKNPDDLPFYNKINVYSNVANGYGIFSAYAIDSKSIIVE